MRVDAAALPNSSACRLACPPFRSLPQITITADDEDSRGAFSSDIDPATLGPPPEWGTPFMPPLAPAPPEPPAPPSLEASEPGPEPVPEAEAEAAKADELD